MRLLASTQAGNVIFVKYDKCCQVRLQKGAIMWPTVFLRQHNAELITNGCSYYGYTDKC